MGRQRCWHQGTNVILLIKVRWNFILQLLNNKFFEITSVFVSAVSCFHIEKCCIAFSGGLQSCICWLHSTPRGISACRMIHQLMCHLLWWLNQHSSNIKALNVSVSCSYVEANFRKVTPDFYLLEIKALDPLHWVWASTNSSSCPETNRSPCLPGCSVSNWFIFSWLWLSRWKSRGGLFSRHYTSEDVQSKLVIQERIAENRNLIM